MSKPKPGDFVTECPKCGGDLFVVGGVFSARIRISPDGFSTQDAKTFDTQDEVVACGSCSYRGPLAMVGDEPKPEFAKTPSGYTAYVDTFDGDTQITAEEQIAAAIFDRLHGENDNSISEASCADLGRSILRGVLLEFRPDLFVTVTPETKQR